MYEHCLFECSFYLPKGYSRSYIVFLVNILEGLLTSPHQVFFDFLNLQLKQHYTLYSFSLFVPPTTNVLSSIP